MLFGVCFCNFANTYNTANFSLAQALFVIIFASPCAKLRYTRYMKHFFRSIFPRVFFESPEYFRALMLGCLYLLLLILQLFAFEKMYGIVSGYALPGGAPVAVVVTALIPILEFAALPFLFSMLVPSRFWRLSRAAAVTSPLLWVTIVAYLGLSGHDTALVGIFGAKVPLYFGWWVLALAVSMATSAAIVARELPERVESKKKTTT